MAFAINVLFFTWHKPGETLTAWLIQSARRDQENSRVELNVTTVSERIFTFQEKCAKSIPKWRWTAGLIAVLILGTQFLLSSKTPVNYVGMATIAMAMSPLVGIALFLGTPALNCARKNRNDLKPPLSTLGLLNVKDIGDKILESNASQERQERPSA